MSLKERIAKQVPVYLLSEVIILFAGLISFPIFTRLFSKEEYGIMSLINLTVMVISTFLDLGQRQAIFRFYEEYKVKGKLAVFLSSMLWGNLCVTLLSVFAICSASYLLFKLHVITPSLLYLLLIGCVLIIFRVLNNITFGVLRIQEKAFAYSWIGISSKYAGIFLAIIFAKQFHLGLYGFFLGFAFIEGINALALFIFLTRKYLIKMSLFSKAIFTQMLTFGFPLIFVSFSTLLLNMGGRYIIGILLGTVSVAIYSVAYNLIYYINDLIIKTVTSGFYPIIMNAWGRGEAEDAKNMLEKFLIYYFMLSLPIIFGVISLGKEIITLLASTKYIDSVNLLPLLTIGVMLSGLSFPFSMCLYKDRKTKNIAIVTIISAGINIVLNFSLLPFMGLNGAALATLLCFVFNFICFKKIADKIIKLTIPVTHGLKYLILSFLMMLLLQNIKIEYLSVFNQLLFKFLLGSVFYAMCLLASDRMFRKLLAYSFELSIKRLPLFKKVYNYS